jgi:hypothetical protein
MNEIICPNCKKAFKVDEAGFADILKQVRDHQFEEELGKRLKLAENEKESAVKLAEANLKSLLQEDLARKDKELLELNRNSQTKGTFKLIRFELLELAELNPVHRLILESTKKQSNVYKLLIENTTKLGKAKDIFYRLGVLRALNNNEKSLQNLIAENLKAEKEAKKEAKKA